MITIRKLTDAINRDLIKIFPIKDYTYYITQLPKDFQRPSFFIDYITTTYSKANVYTITETYHYQIIYFHKIDDYYNVDLLELQDILQQALRVFRKGIIACDDRAIKLTITSAEVTDNEFAIDLKFSFNQVVDEEQEDYELMQELKLALNTGTRKSVVNNQGLKILTDEDKELIFNLNE